ncbi:1065_t:CDS:2, partial [Paraglomus occultum]
MKVLCVAEKPSVAKSIAQILSGGRISNRNTKDKYIKNYDFLCKDAENRDVRVTMTSVKGHLMAIDFPEQYQVWGKCSPLCLFEAPIIKSVMKGMEPIRDNIASEAAKSDKLIIWTDCDREGENIGAEIVNVSRQANHRIQVLRARFSSISNQPIIQAWRSPVQLDTRQVAAVDARSELDLRIGAAFTRFQTLGFKRLIQGAQKQVISYGSCQFPTLGFVVDQYLKAENFITETFWKISVTLERDGSKVEFWWARGHLFDQLACLVLYEQCVEHPIATVLKVQSKETKKWKPYPLTTVELQKAGTRFLRMSSQKIMTVAEALYNKGFISYPRTETNEFPPSMDLKSLITAQETSTVWGDYARKLSNGAFRAPRKGKQNDQAHPPIHPTKNTASLTGDEKTVYEFIVRRFLACCSDDAKGNETHVEISIADENFSTT